MFRQLVRSVARQVAPAPAMKMAPSQQAVRSMSDKPHVMDKRNITIDPTEHERDITLVVNPVTKEYEAIVLCASERSLEFVHSSPVDTHTFEVMPVIKDSVSDKGEFDYDDY